MIATAADRAIAAEYLAIGWRSHRRCAAAALCGHGAYMGAPDLGAVELHVAQAQALRAVILEIRESTP